jgi:hypothetical protein
MGSKSDQASSMTKALETFEGAPCVAHKIQNAMKHASRGAFITQLENSCRGMLAHFRRSSKVIHILLTLLTRHDLNLMFHSQTMSALREWNENITRPNQGSVTKWGGMIDIYM